MSESPKIGVIILAAGTSKRLGQPKQLVSFRGKNLLQHSIDCTENLTLVSKILVLGANAEKVKREINSKSFQTVINERWEEGMASSVRIGVEKSITMIPNLEAILILVSDQPFVSKELLHKMIKLYKSESSNVVCRYGEGKGVPALFGSKYFNELLQLKGDHGARKIIQDHEEMQSIVTFDQGNFDVDTPEDLERLNNL